MLVQADVKDLRAHRSGYRIDANNLENCGFVFVCAGNRQERRSMPFSAAFSSLSQRMREPLDSKLKHRLDYARHARY